VFRQGGGTWTGAGRMMGMTIDAHMFRKNKWVLGRNRRELDSGGGTGSRRFDFDGYWSGKKWVKSTTLAAVFDSKTDALQYLDANITQIEA